jgi:DNA-binding XRE family transcriptional regulator
MDTHPCRKWRDKKGLSRSQVAALLAEKGRRVSPKAIELIENSWRHPGADLCLAISSLMQIPISTLRAWPLRQPGERAA